MKNPYTVKVHRDMKEVLDEIKKDVKDKLGIDTSYCKASKILADRYRKNKKIIL